MFPPIHCFTVIMDKISDITWRQILFQDFWAYWETYKGIVELLKAPKFLLVCDKWDELKFVTSAHFVK